MVQSAESVVVARTVAEVFRYVADLRNEPNWHVDVAFVSPETDPVPVVGKTYDLKFKPFMGKTDDPSESFLGCAPQTGSLPPQLTEAGSSWRVLRVMGRQPTRGQANRQVDFETVLAQRIGERTEHSTSAVPLHPCTSLPA